MERYVCVHGHFYQPPRENPWLEAIQLQDSAYPFHDWNERITAECYAPNVASRILNGDGQIVKLINNYSKISFNIGPTILAWLELKEPDIYAAVLEADRLSQEQFSGHGSAMAQAYNHLIMPLATSRDKVTQVRWGIRDFERRFGRAPEGMWLPETAVDLETLDILAEQGLRFTILSPHQAAEVRPLHGDEEWQDASAGRVDPSMPYVVSLPSGRTIALFFYDGPISQSVAFEGLLSRGEQFADRLLMAFQDGRDRPQLGHIATDGETYGHHRPHGDMALAYALHHIETNGLARLTNYGEYLERFPPTHEVRIFENTAWSCFHGVERWRSDCGCNSGMHGSWGQHWRTPLRRALDWLRDATAPLYEAKARTLLRDPWAARDDYIEVMLDRSLKSVDAFFARHADRDLTQDERVTALKLLELQRDAQLMYTSCGWFFDELSGIETVQVIQYAGRVVQLAEELFDMTIEGPFLALLEEARSNLPEHGNGRHIYDKWVRPARVDLAKVAAHFAVSSLFEYYADRTAVYSYLADCDDYQSFEAGMARLAIGRARITSTITHETGVFSFAVLHLGHQHLSGGVRPYEGEDTYQEMVRELAEPFARGDLPGVYRLLDSNFRDSTHSLRSLFGDEQRQVMRLIMDGPLAEAEMLFRGFYERHAPLMRFLTDLQIPLPRRFHAAADLAINTGLRQLLETDTIDTARVASVVEEAAAAGIGLDATGLGFSLKQSLEHAAEQLRGGPTSVRFLQKLDAAASAARLMPFDVNLWKPQNVFYELREKHYPMMREQAGQGDEAAQAWITCFVDLGHKLAIKVEV